MSQDNFLSFLQQLLTMVDSENRASVALAKMSLEAVIELARESQMADAVTMRMMISAMHTFEHLAEQKSTFAGKKGDYQGNHIRRERLKNVLFPSC